MRLSIPLTLLALLGVAYSAYKGHADDRDVNAIVAAYPGLKNAAADSCSTCHNGGRSSFAIVAIRVNPLPQGMRDYEWEKARDQFVAEGKVVIFGVLKDPKR